MKSRFTVAALAAALLAACAGSPATHTAAPNVEAVPGPGVQAAGLSGPIAVANTGEAGDDKEVCRKLDPYTGSRVGGRTVCLTQAEWDARKEASRQFTEDVQATGKWNFKKSD